MKAQWSVFLLLAMVATATLPGCGDEVKLDEQATIMPVDTAKKSRELFDKVAGDYNALTEADRKTYLDLFEGDEARAKKTWDIMANPPGSGPTGM